MDSIKFYETPRDFEILKLIYVFGRTYTTVLAKTFFNGEQQARNRMNKLIKRKVIRYKPTGLIKPQKAIFLTDFGKELLLLHSGLEKRFPYKVPIITLRHHEIEQISYFWLNRIGEVERTSNYAHRHLYKHVPDMICTLPNGKKVFVEVEISMKSKFRYEELAKSFNQTIFEPYKQNVLLYVTRDKKDLKLLASKFSSQKKFLTFIDIDTLIENIKSSNKVHPYKQSELIK